MLTIPSENTFRSCGGMNTGQAIGETDRPLALVDEAHKPMKELV